MTELFIPSAIGKNALLELDRVPWGELRHAYGKGVVRGGAELCFDVAASLRHLGSTVPTAVSEAVEAMFANLCHQGTIYEATPHAIPFLAAFGAGTRFGGGDDAVLFGVLLSSIGVASSFETKHGSRSGSFGEEVAPRTREAFRVSKEHLHAMALMNPKLAELHETLVALVAKDPPDPDAVERLETLFDD